MKQYIKDNSCCLIETAKQNIKTYECADAVCDAITNGTLLEGEMWQIKTNEGIHTDTVDSVNYLLSVTPGIATPQNMLVTQCDLSAATDLTSVCSRICQNETDISSLCSCKTDCSDFNALASRVGVNETNITTNTGCITCRVQCCDYIDCVTTLNCNINTIRTDAAALTNRVCCNETNITDLQTTIACKVTCSDYTTCIGAINDDISCKVTCADYTTCIGTVTSDIATNANCIDDLKDRVCCAEADIATNTGCIDCLNACSGLSCTGTVNTITDMACGTVYSATNGNIDLPIPHMSLSGTVLTITV